MLMRPDGRLSPSGVAYVQRVIRSPLDGEDIQRIFDPDSDLTREERGLRLSWREQIVAADVRETMRVRPARLDSAGAIDLTGTPTPGLFASTDGPKFVLVDWTLAQIFTFLVEAAAIPVTAEAFQVAGEDLREWTVVRFFAHALRGERDDEFTAAYAKTHVHYLSRRFTDPLQMVAPAVTTPGPLQALAMTLQQFWGLAAMRLSGSSERRDRHTSLDDRTARTFRSGLPWVSEQIILGAQQWFDFLFGPDSFVGDLLNRRMFDALADGSSACDGLEGITGVKRLGAKRPDIIQIHVHRQRIEVLDATMRPLDRWHNFKTETYAAVLRAIVANLTDADWVVEALDFRSQRLVNPL